MSLLNTIPKIRGNLPPSTRQSIVIPLLGGEIEGELVTFNDLSDPREHIAIRLGPWRTTKQPLLVRLHSECLTGDVFASCKCDCGPQLQEAIRKIHEEGGILLYLRQEGRDIGLYNKVDAYVLQSQGYDTFEANRMLRLPDDNRDYAFAAEMLKALGLKQIRLLSNNPDKAEQLRDYGVEIVERVPTGAFVNAHNQSYLSAKVRHSSHSIDLENESND